MQIVEQSSKEMGLISVRKVEAETTGIIVWQSWITNFENKPNNEGLQ